MASQLSPFANSSPDEIFVAYATKGCTSVDRAVRGGGRCDYEKRTSLPGSISKSRVKESVVFGLMISSVNFTKTESSRKMAYLSIDSKSIAMKNGQGDSGSTRFPHLMLRTSGIFSNCIRAFIIIASTRAGVTSGLSLYRTT